jgi:molecular chaperone GrpE
MSDEPLTDEPVGLTREVAAAPCVPGEAEPSVEFVVPPVVYDTVDTDDELARTFTSTPTPTPEPDNRVLEAVEVLGSTFEKRLEALQSLFEREVRAEANREKIVDRLHAELQDYKQDLLLSTLRPIFVDLIQLHDDVGKMRPTVAPPDSANDALFRLIDAVQQGIEDILYRQGVEPFGISDDIFDPRRQRAVSTVPTDIPELNKHVATRHRRGFTAGEKIIRPEVVSVYSYRP